MFAFPASILTAVTVALAFGLIAVSMVVITVALDGDSTAVSPEASMSDVALGWLTDRHKSADARQELYDKILFDGPDQQRRLVRFFALMAFASIIAAMGVITDSTAVVIGAMLIAPLMTPLMAIGRLIGDGLAESARDGAARRDCGHRARHRYRRTAGAGGAGSHFDGDQQPNSCPLDANVA